MEPHIPSSHGEEPHTAVVEGEGEPHHEKRSVLRKVKDKAKKIKGTLTKQGHGQDHDEEEDEMVADSEDHGAPGREEAGINPILTSFNKMSVHEPEPKPKPKPGPEQKLSTGSHDQFSPEPIPSNNTTTNPENSGSLPKSSDSSELEDMQRDKLSGTSAIADKAASAKDVVASNLGYAGGGNEDAGGGNATKSSASPTVYAQKIAATVTGKFAPVYGKVAGAGSTVMSKVYGGGTGQEGADKKGPDKSVSVKEYVAEKFRPSEEDRALSEVISGTIRKPKEGAEKTVQEKPVGDRPISEVVSDALHKRNDNPENEGGTRAMGKVTESEEVVKRLGAGIEDPKEDGDATKIGTEKGTVGWLKGTVNAWLGGGGETQTSQATTTSGEGGQGHDNDVLAETRHEGEGK